MGLFFGGTKNKAICGFTRTRCIERPISFINKNLTAKGKKIINDLLHCSGEGLDLFRAGRSKQLKMQKKIVIQRRLVFHAWKGKERKGTLFKCLVVLALER